MKDKIEKILRLETKIRRIILVIVVLFLTTTFSAQALTGSNTGESWENAVYGSGYNKQSFDKGAFENLVRSAINSIVGCGYTTLCPDTDRSGALGKSVELATVMYDNPPASGVTYVAYLMDNIGIVEPAYAQQTPAGFGFNAFTGILPLWRAFRNIAYIIFVLVFAAIGFSIMFRQRISPQAVMTIQAALPKVIIALIMVTFSYAIAGFMIDISYVLFLVILRGIETMGGITTVQATGIENDYLSGGFLQTIGRIIGTGLGAIRDILGGVLPNKPNLPTLPSFP